jgi:hypothetical protein
MSGVLGGGTTGVPNAAAPFWGVIVLAPSFHSGRRAMCVCRADSTRIRDERGEAIRS